MDWRERYREKVVSAAEAAAQIESGQVITVGFNLSAPRYFLDALGDRARDLADVTLYQHLAVHPSVWYEESAPPGIHVISGYLSPLSRPGVARGQIDVEVMTVWTASKPEQGGRRKRDHMYPDVTAVSISPPDENGLVSFGTQLWYHKTWVRRAGLVIGEVNENYIRTGGDNFIHVDEFDLLVEQPEPLPVPTLQRDVPVEDLEAAQTIGGLVSGLIQDGDCIQIGFGLMSGATAVFLDTKNELGFHAELMPAGVIPLIREGNITGARKTIDRGLHVATGLFLNPEDYAYVDGNPAFALHECRYTNSPKVLAQIDDFVAINAALSVDLTGQINAEAFGPRMYSGVAGQLDFQMGAMLSDGGRGITVLPATARGSSVSRIVAQFPEGQVVSVPRTYADFIVTEYGIASLQGRTQRDRAAALIEIAHPDFRDQLRDEAKRLFG
jgi:4-hydroxybutyrate CoA-transferase